MRFTCVQWGRYNSDFVLGTRPYVAAAMIGATYLYYNISLYASIPSPNKVNLMPMKAMVMTGSNFSAFQVCSCHLLQNHFPSVCSLGCLIACRMALLEGDKPSLSSHLLVSLKALC